MHDILLDNLPERLQAEDPEEQRIITGVSWKNYQSLLSDFGDSLAYRVTYLDRVIEILAPSRRHERRKTQIGTLLEIYFVETNTEYFPMGSTTLSNPAIRVGTEPDESYCIGTDKESPDLVIDTIFLYSRHTP